MHIRVTNTKQPQMRPDLLFHSVLSVLFKRRLVNLMKQLKPEECV